MKTRLFALEITLEQYNTIKTALQLELERLGADDYARALLTDALQAVNAAQVKN